MLDRQRCVRQLYHVRIERAHRSSDEHEGTDCLILLLSPECVHALRQAALTTFDDTGGNEMDIELVTQEVTRLFRKCEAQLQRFGEQRSSSEADEKVWMQDGHLNASHTNSSTLDYVQLERSRAVGWCRR